MNHLITDRIRVSVVGLAAQVAICEQLCSRTNGGDTSNYAVALHEQHFRELFLAATTPPVTHSNTTVFKDTKDQTDPQSQQQNLNNHSNQASLLMMGFPSRTLAPKDNVSFCACHHRPTREGYACTRCRAKVCRLPADCPVCGLTLVLSTHLARSYHHLFPLRGWVEVSWAQAAAHRLTACFACLAPFPAVPASALLTEGKGKGNAATAEGGNTERGTAAASSAGKANSEAKGGVPPEAKTAGVSESGRYACTVCGNHFCIDCDVFAHEMIHNCPGCQSDTRGGQEGQQAQGGSNGETANGGSGGGSNGRTHGNGTSGDAMVID